MAALRAAALAAAAALLAACAAVTTADGMRLGLGSDEFKAYAERVFRDQNKVASDLAFALEDAGAAAAAELDSAEDELLAACAGLNEVATTRRDDQPLGVRAKLGAARRAPDCERATRAAQAALDRVERQAPLDRAKR
jgi:hypothetical protein